MNGIIFLKYLILPTNLFVKVADLSENIPNLMTSQSIDHWRYQHVRDDEKCRDAISSVDDETVRLDERQIVRKVQIYHGKNKASARHDH